MLPKSEVVLFFADGDHDCPSGVQMIPCTKMKMEQTLNPKYKVEVCHGDWSPICKNCIVRVFSHVQGFLQSYQFSITSFSVLNALTGVHK